MNNDTRLKVNEAHYFLSMMKKTFGDTSDEFYFNMNAFLTASRAITLYMQKQYKKCNGFAEWYCPRQIQMSNDSDLQFLLKMRNQIIHRNPVDTITELVCYSPGLIINNADSEEEIDRKFDALPDPEINVYRRFFEKTGEEIIEFCETQSNKLTSFVDECESMFGSCPLNV